MCVNVCKRGGYVCVSVSRTPPNSSRPSESPLTQREVGERRLSLPESDPLTLSGLTSVTPTELPFSVFGLLVSVKEVLPYLDLGGEEKS